MSRQQEVLDDLLFFVSATCAVVVIVLLATDQGYGPALTVALVGFLAAQLRIVLRV